MKDDKKEQKELADKKQVPIFGPDDLVVNCLALYERGLQVEQDSLVDSISKKQSDFKEVNQQIIDVKKAVKLAVATRDEKLAAKKKA
jgi:hypothetical protein